MEQSHSRRASRMQKDAEHTAAGIPTWSPTVVLICRSTAYVWQSGRDAQFSADCGHISNPAVSSQYTWVSPQEAAMALVQLLRKTIPVAFSVIRL
ncbi:hypothetical protein KCU65_g2163, partial [Aureobasidium melanogenum]